MEQKNKVKLTPVTTFDLEKGEIKNLYIYLSLFQHRWLRTPDYRERVLIEALKNDFKKNLLEMQKQTEQDPNNLILSKVRNFFDIHYQQLKRITDEYTERDEDADQIAE